MGMIKEIKDLKCPGHEYIHDGCNFVYEVPYASFRPLPNTLCKRCGDAMSLLETQIVKYLIF